LRCRALYIRRPSRTTALEAEFADIFIRTRDAHLAHDNAKAELKSLMPEDAKQAIGHGIRAKRSKSGAISFDLVQVEGQTHAAV
jgi:hypothetical protein